MSQTADDKVHQSSLLHLVASHLRVRQLNTVNHDVPGHLRGAVRALGSTLGGGFGLARCAMPVQFYLLWLIILIPGCT